MEDLNEMVYTRGKVSETEPLTLERIQEMKWHLHREGYRISKFLLVSHRNMPLIKKMIAEDMSELNCSIGSVKNIMGLDIIEVSERSELCLPQSLRDTLKENVIVIAHPPTDADSLLLKLLGRPMV